MLKQMIGCSAFPPSVANGVILATVANGVILARVTSGVILATVASIGRRRDNVLESKNLPMSPQEIFSFICLTHLRAGGIQFFLYQTDPP